MYRSLLISGLLGLLLVTGCDTESPVSTDEMASDTLVLRIATYNIEDVRTADVLNPDHPRLKKAAATIQRLRPDILLINEVTYDQPGGPGVLEGDPPGQNGQRFADTFLAVSQGEGLQPLRYQAYQPPTNTGLASGLDLNNDGKMVDTFPVPALPNPNGTPAPQTQPERDYGNDAWGFGTFPGQYGMALFVREGLEIVRDSVRTFRLLSWQAMPDALRPVDPDTETSWYADEEWAKMRLSSKTHADIPVRLPGGRLLHILASHPTPPAFDGKEQRNVRRNHDEIRFWADYLAGAAYVVDDSSRTGGLLTDAVFVIMGDLNADPDEGSSLNDPITTHLLNNPRINGSFVPRATEAGLGAFPDLDPDDTAQWGLRVDYVLPSVNLMIREGGVWRPTGDDTTGVQVSDHFPVWLDVIVK